MGSWQAAISETLNAMARAHYALLDANIGLRGPTERDEEYALRIVGIDTAAVALVVRSAVISISFEPARGARS